MKFAEELRNIHAKAEQKKISDKEEKIRDVWQQLENTLRAQAQHRRHYHWINGKEIASDVFVGVLERLVSEGLCIKDQGTHVRIDW